jgi:hypothetical protein
MNLVVGVYFGCLLPSTLPYTAHLSINASHKSGKQRGRREAIYNMTTD